jgi:hypothetical protein
MRWSLPRIDGMSSSAAHLKAVVRRNHDRGKGDGGAWVNAPARNIPGFTLWVLATSRHLDSPPLSRSSWGGGPCGFASADAALRPRADTKGHHLLSQPMHIIFHPYYQSVFARWNGSGIARHAPCCEGYKRFNPICNVLGNRTKLVNHLKCRQIDRSAVCGFESQIKMERGMDRGIGGWRKDDNLRSVEIKRSRYR